MNYQKVLLAPVPLTVDVVKSPRISRCASNTMKTNEFCMLFMCSTERRMMKPRIPKPTSGHLDRSFFFRCPEDGLEFVFSWSCGWWNREFLIRPLDTLVGRFFWCPEVRLGFVLWRSIGCWNGAFLIRPLDALVGRLVWCPEVRLEFVLWRSCADAEIENS